MTKEQLIAEIEAGKRAAAARIDRDMGPGAWDRLVAYSKSDANRHALDGICRVLKSTEE